MTVLHLNHLIFHYQRKMESNEPYATGGDVQTYIPPSLEPLEINGWESIGKGMGSCFTSYLIWLVGVGRVMTQLCQVCACHNQCVTCMFCYQ